METLESIPILSPSPSTPSPSSDSSRNFSFGNPNLQSPSSKSSPQPQSSLIRLWRPAAQRNLKNQWLRLASYRQQWVSASSDGRSHATSLVNSYLSQRYMDAMNLGVLSDMPNIRMKACKKLFQQQELHRNSLLSSYKRMVNIATHLVNISRSMRCYFKGTSDSSLVQFSNYSNDKNDLGDCGGTPVFTFWSVSSFEILAQELIEMFVLELNVKRLLVVELLDTSCQAVAPVNRLHWTDELYPAEIDDLSICNLYSKETRQLDFPTIKGCKSAAPMKSNQQPEEDVLKVYLTTWLAEVNVDVSRVDEVFTMVGEEMHASIS